MAEFPSLLWLNSIELYRYINHNFLIHSPVDGCLSCFYVLTIVNNAEHAGASWHFALCLNEKHLHLKNFMLIRLKIVFPNRVANTMELRTS